MKKVAVLYFLLLSANVLVAQDCPTETDNGFLGIYFADTETAPAAGNTCSLTGNYSQGDFAGSTLTIDGDFTINGDFSIYDNLIVNGTLTITGDFSTDIGANITVNNGGALNVNGDFDNGGFFSSIGVGNPDGNVAGQITVGGDFNNNAGGSLTIGNGGTLDVTGNFDSDSASDITVQDGGVVDSGSFTGDETVVTVDAGGSFLDDSSPLPVELTSFTAGYYDALCELKWETSSELNNAGFAIERKEKNQTEFIEIAFIDGSGTTNQKQSYYFSDDAISGGAYYRLKQEDYDGAYEYSPTIFAENSNTKIFKIYPNPFVGTVKVALSGSEFMVKVLDYSGTTYSAFYATDVPKLESELSAALQALAPSHYLVIISNRTKVYQTKIVIN